MTLEQGAMVAVGVLASAVALLWKLDRSALVKSRDAETKRADHNRQMWENCIKDRQAIMQSLLAEKRKRSD